MKFRKDKGKALPQEGRAPEYVVHWRLALHVRDSKLDTGQQCTWAASWLHQRQHCGLIFQRRHLLKNS